MINQIHIGDCLELMFALDESSIDLIVADLPYGITSHPDDQPLDLPIFWNHCRRLLKADGLVVLTAQGRFAAELILSNIRWFKYELVWDKVLVSGHLNAKQQPLRCHEWVLIFSPSRGFYAPQMTPGDPLHSEGGAFKREAGQIRNGNYNDYARVEDTRHGSTEKYPRSILHFQKPHSSKARHRTEKPVALIEYLVRTYSPHGGVVLDPVIGSGTTAEACIRTGRQWIGFEKDPKIAAEALRRVREAGGSHDYA